MRALTKPNYPPGLVYQTCVNSISNAFLQNRLALITNDVIAAETDYDQRGDVGQLFTIQPNHCSNDQIAMGGVTKDELTDVYTSHMVGKIKPAREIYDSLIARAPLGRCPLCGFGAASTLDHYLPKAKYPQLSVVALNLVPSCKDCNTGKRAAIPTRAEEQGLHPYFDHQNYITDQWLHAEVLQTVPATVRFFVNPPANWNNLTKARVAAHFASFNLAKRYSDETTPLLATLRDTLISCRDALGPAGIAWHLTVQAQSHAKSHANSWQTAIFQALAANNWYCDGGFL